MVVGDESDTIEAYVALGGDADKGGKVSTEKLRAVIKVVLSFFWAVEDGMSLHLESSDDPAPLTIFNPLIIKRDK